MDKYALHYSLRLFLLCAIALVNGSIARADVGNDRRYEIGLSMYSLRQLFWDGELHVHDFPAFAQETFGINKIDVWDGGYPKGWRADPEFLPELKRRADAVGSEIFLVMTGMVNAEPKNAVELRKNGLEFKSAVDQAVVLGARFVRVFLRIDKSAKDTESMRRASIALGALADYAKLRGVTVVIEPNPKYTPLGAYLAKLMELMDHPNCRLMPDFGKMKGTDVYQGTQDMMSFSPVVSAKGHDFNRDDTQRDFDYPRLLDIIKSSGFEGIIAIEYEGKNRPPVAGIKLMQAILTDE